MRPTEPVTLVDWLSHAHGGRGGSRSHWKGYPYEAVGLSPEMRAAPELYLLSTIDMPGFGVEHREWVHIDQGTDVGFVGVERTPRLAVVHEGQAFELVSRQGAWLVYRRGQLAIGQQDE